MERICKSLVFCLIGCLVLFFSGISPAAEKNPYTLGMVVSVTGMGSFLGDPQKKTAEMLVERFNNTGGINGHPLKVIIYDDESDDTKARLLASKLIKTENVLAIFGPSLTGTSMALVDLAQSYKIPLISLAASWQIATDPKTNKERYWVFKIPANDTHCVENIYNFLKYKGINKIAILADNLAYGSSGREALIRMAPNYGMTIAADEKFGPKDVDMSVQLTRIKASEARVIIGWTAGPAQVTIVRNWRDLGMTNIPFIQSFAFGNRRNIKLAAGAAEGVYTPVTASTIARLLPDTHIQKKVAMEYTLAFEPKYGEPVSLYGGNAWDAIMLLVSSLKEVGEKHTSLEATRKAIRDYLEVKKGYIGQHGVFNFSPEHHVGLNKDAYEMVVVKGDDFALVPIK